MMVGRKRWCRFDALTCCCHYIEQSCIVRNDTIALFFYLVSLALINSFTVFCQIGDKRSFVDFQIEICRCLLKSDKEVDSDEDMNNPPRFQRSLKAKQIPDQVRNDRVSHWPIKCHKPNRCKQDDCIKRSLFIFSKCQNYISVSSDCFLKFHGVV